MEVGGAFEPVELSDISYYTYVDDSQTKRSVSEQGLLHDLKEVDRDSDVSSHQDYSSYHQVSTYLDDAMSPPPPIFAVSATPPRRSLSSRRKITSFFLHKSKSFDNEPANTKTSTKEWSDETSLDFTTAVGIPEDTQIHSRMPRHLNRKANRTISHSLSPHSSALSHSQGSPFFRLRSSTCTSSQNKDGASPKTRRISTPEMLNRRHLHHRKSLESQEQLKAMRAGLIARNASNSNLKDRKIDKTEEIEFKTPQYYSPSPSSRPRKISNFLRKISVSTKNLSWRSLHLPLERSTSNGSANHHDADRDNIINERDRAIEEWSESAMKCEELIDELDRTLSELMFVKSDRDSKQSELDHLIGIYQTDVEDRDMEIEDLQTKILELDEVQAVLRSERDEAFDQRDEHLQKSYQLSKQIKQMKCEINETIQDQEKMKQQYQRLNYEAENLREENLQLKKNNNNIRKTLPMLILDSPVLTDDVIKKNADLSDFDTSEENMESLKKERDKLRLELDRIRKLLTLSAKTKHLSLSTSYDDNWLEESLSSPLNEIPSAITISGSDALNDIDNNNQPAIDTTDDNILSTPCEKNGLEYYEDLAICIDTFDSRTGLKLDNAFDEPRVIVSDVTKQLTERWNIKKYDRIVSVNGTSVHRADKKVVERLIKDTLGRTISLVLRREKIHSGSKNFSEIEVAFSKQCDSGLKFSVRVESVDEKNKELSPGLENIQVGDVISKINSQDINSMLNILIKKLSKKSSNNRVTFRVKREDNTPDQFLETPKKPMMSQSRSFNTISRPRKLSSDSARHILSDISSLFSFASTRGDDTNSLFKPIARLPTGGRASFHGFSNIPPHQPPPPRLTKQRALNVPSISVEEHITPVENAENRRHYSPQHSTSFESFTQSILNESAEPAPGQNYIPPNTSNGNLLIDPSRRQHRPSPRLRRIEDDSSGSERGVRQYKSKSLYLEVLNRRSFANSLIIPDPEDQQRVQTTSRVLPPVESTKIPQTLRNVSGYATLPRRYRLKSSKQHSRLTKAVRINKSENQKIGIKVNGGNKVGVFVTEIVRGSPAESSNLRVGDKLLNLNSIDLTRATLDFATRVLVSNETNTKIRLHVEEIGEDYLDLLQNPFLESLYVRTLHSYNATNLNEMSFKAGDILHITDTRFNFDEENMVWTWYGARKVSSSKQTEGEIPAIKGFDQMSDVSPHDEDKNLDSTSKKRLRRLSKSAQDLKRWLARKPSIRRKKGTVIKRDRSFSNGDQSRRSSFYEILLEEPLVRL